MLVSAAFALSTRSLVQTFPLLQVVKSLLMTVAYRTVSNATTAGSGNSQESCPKVGMTLREAGEQLSVHPETLRRMAVATEIPALRIRSRWVIPTQFVHDWVSGHADRWLQNPEGTWQRHDPGYENRTSSPDLEGAEDHPIPPTAR